MNNNVIKKQFDSIGAILMLYLNIMFLNKNTLLRKTSFSELRENLVI